ncbi:MAG TPA: cyclic nucleotide-binding domain-containing protein [Chloroflexi bacterium]|nr:cyclic nucleotide-binding domain-containing protein [Chloroflexota bacterium]
MPHLRALAGLVRQIEHRAGVAVCHQGQPGQRYFVVERGALRATRVDPEGRAVEVRRMGPGDAFGETSLLLGDTRDATVECIQDTVLLYIKKEDFDRLLEAEPRIERALRMRPEVAERRRYPRFSWLEEGELPIKVLHRHPAVLVPGLLIPVVITLVMPLTGALVLASWGSLALALGLILALIPFGFSLYTYIDWRNDVYIVTNRRVVHRERTGLVREHFSAAPLHAIQDVQQVQVGILARFCGFGDVIIETAGEAGQVVFRSIPDPGQVRDAIFGQIERTRAWMRAEERAAIRQVMYRYFLGKEEEETTETPPQAPEAPPRVRGRLLASLTILRSLFPSTWHREGTTVTWRKHWVALIRTIGLPVLISILISMIILVVATKAQDMRAFAIVLYALAMFILVPWALWRYEDWQNDFYQATATRIVHVERLPFFLREIRREASLEQVTNVRFDQSFWGRILKYGDVIVETAAPAGTFHFQMVSRPQDVQAEIFAHIEAARRRRQEQEAERQRAGLLDWFSVYDEIRRTAPPPSGEQEPE